MLRRTSRLLRPAAASAVVLAALVTACAGGGQTDSNRSSSAPSTPSATNSASPAAGDKATPAVTRPSPSNPVKTLQIEIAHGEATPNAERVELRVGTTIRLAVTSDTEDEVHVHGYDKEVAVKPGTPATLTFVADQTGRFEIETHETGTLLYQLIVMP